MESYVVKIYLILYFFIIRQQNMTALSNQISYFMGRALQINKKIGGTTAYYSQDKNKDKFSVMKEQVMKSIHYIKQKLKQKEKIRSRAEQIRNENQIKDKISDIQSNLQKMNQYLKKNPKHKTEKNMEVFQLLKDQTQNYKDIIEGNLETTRSAKGQINLTITDMKAQLLQTNEKDKKNKQTKRIKKQQQMNEVQMQAKKRFDQNDLIIQQGLGRLIDKTQEWKKKAQMMGQAIDTTTKQITNLDSKVDNLNSKLVSANQDLKAIVNKFRKPHQFCMDITLILILIGLIIGIIKLTGK